MILVIGANGRVGGRVTEVLIKAGVRPRLFVRNTASAEARFGSDVEVVPGDLAHAESVDAALAGAHAVLLCSPVHPEQVQFHSHVVAAAQRQRAYVVKVSGLATFPNSYVSSGAWHAQTEKSLEDSELNYTCLQPFFFMQNLLFQLPMARTERVIRSGVGDARIAMIDVIDLADLAAALLLNPDLAPRQTLPVTDTVTHSYADVADAFSVLLGHPVTYEAQSADEIKENLRASGMPDWHVALLLQFNQAFHEGLGASVHDTVERLLARPPTSLTEMLARDAARSGGAEDPFPS